MPRQELGCTTRCLTNKNVSSKELMGWSAAEEKRWKVFQARGPTTGNQNVWLPGRAARPSGFGARTVLGGKGSLCRAAKRRALASCAPFCQLHDMEIHTNGIDLGKTVFHLMGVDSCGNVLVRKRFSRIQLLAYTACGHRKRSL